MNTDPTLPGFDVPADACDSHVHFFGNRQHFPLAARRGYTPDPVGPDTFFAIAGRVGIQRAIFVLPSAYGSNNDYLLHTLTNERQRLRGVCVLGESPDPSHMRLLADAGVRGARLNLVSTGQVDAEAARRRLGAAARVAAEFGWHVQAFMRMELAEALENVIAALPVPLVFDHMALPVAYEGRRQKGMDAVLRLLAAGKIWIKLSGTYHVSPDELGNHDVTAVARGYLEENSDRLIWGSDWPHMQMHARIIQEDPPHLGFREIDYGRLLGSLHTWCDGNEALMKKVLVDNPAALYGY